MLDVKKLYDTFVQAGMSEKDAAIQAQERTGFSVVTGNPIKQKKLQFSKGRITYGQFSFKK